MKRIGLLLAIAALSCGSTGGALVTLPFRAGGVAGPLTFTTPTGWTVTLQTAKIALGPFYFNTQAPNTQSFRNGTVIIEVTQQVVVDVLDPVLHDVPGGADGETGAAVSVEIDLFPQGKPEPPACGAVSDDVGIVAGVATKGTVQVNFSGSISFDPCGATPANPPIARQRVRGADVNLQFTAEPQALELRVDPTHWFDQVDFSQLTNGTWDVHSPFLNQLIQGVRQETDVYLFSLVPG
jgi:hypothetical protein